MLGGGRGLGWWLGGTFRRAFGLGFGIVGLAARVCRPFFLYFEFVGMIAWSVLGLGLCFIDPGALGGDFGRAFGWLVGWLVGWLWGDQTVQVSNQFNTDYTK
jgi:hypothetical protein